MFKSTTFCLCLALLINGITQRFTLKTATLLRVIRWPQKHILDTNEYWNSSSECDSSLLILFLHRQNTLAHLPCLPTEYRDRTPFYLSSSVRLTTSPDKLYTTALGGRNIDIVRLLTKLTGTHIDPEHHQD